MRKLEMALGLLLMATLFGCNVKHTTGDDNTPPIDNEPPEAPGLLRGEATSSSSVRLTWVDNSDNEEYFAIYRRESAADSFMLCQRVFFNTTVYDDLGLQDSTTYSYCVTAERGDTSSSRSNIVSVTTLARMTDLEVVASVPFPGNGASMDFYGNYAIVTTSEAKIYPINISNPANPLLGQIYDAPGEICSILISGDGAYLAMGQDGVWLVIIQDPDNPTVLGSCDTPGYATKAWPVASSLKGLYVYAVDGQSLQIINADIPFQLSIAGEFHSQSIPFLYDEAIDLNYAYFACGDSGLQIFNVADPLLPVARGRLNIAGGARKIYLYKRTMFSLFAYILNTTSDIYIVDVSDRGNPALVGSFEVGQSPGAVYVDGNFAYVAYRDGLKVIDISDPAVPVQVAFHLDLNQIGTIKVSGAYIYIVDSGGLKVLRNVS
jgi:hypothetical protein